MIFSAIGALFHTVIYVPLYNGLVFLVDVVPGHDAGLAVIALTILVRIILIPLSRRAIRSQLAMKELAPEIEAIKKRYKKNSPEQTQAIFALYKERDVHPFAGIGLMLIQIPVLLGLYWVFLRGGLPNVDQAFLYPFVHVPGAVNMYFLGFVNMAAKHNLYLALLVVLSQYVYTRLSMGKPERRENIEESLSNDMARSFDIQARYVFPLMFGIISYFVAAAAPLYWLTANLFMIAQEYIAGRRF